ncbi:TatD family hydrolase [Sphingobacterium puteale]|uniref:TatD family hydrolase n=1 Tax=Sphingobacterium puteale TaxID=2420510 RepID=UPI003D99590B
MQAPYIDIHTHRLDIIQDGFNRSIINIALNNNETTVEGDCSIGLHPWYINRNTEKALELMRTMIQRTNVVALGECGLDKNSAIPFEKQQRVFEQQILLAITFQKPLIIHCVRAFQEVLASLVKAKFHLPVIFHGYRKNWTLAKQLMDKGYYLSIGVHCLDGSQDEVVRNIPLTHLFLETDTYTATEVATLYQYVAQARSIPVEMLKQALYHNYKFVLKK